jgi:NodT family efflux transporter outer membrane factor (OMF) lipoprotein
MSLPNKNMRALAMALAVSGCALGPNFVRPAPPTDSSYMMAGDDGLSPHVRLGETPIGPWWEAFASPDLDRVMRQALANNQDLAAADATLARAQAQEAAARGGAFPQADLQTGAQRERINTTAFGFTGFPSPTINLYTLGGGISFDLDLFGARRRRIEGAAARREAEARRADAAYLTLTGRVAEQVFTIAALRAEIAALEGVVADDQRTLDITKRAVETGGAAPTSSAAPEAQLAEDQADLAPLRQQLAAARHALGVLVGETPAAWAAPDFDLAAFAPLGDAPVSLPSTLARRRPDILAAEADLHAALADAGVATAELFPHLTLSATLTQSALTPDDIFTKNASGWNVGAGLAGPLFHGGTLRAGKRAADAAARVALARYRQVVLEAFAQTADAMQALDHDAQEVAARARAEDSAGRRLRAAQAAFERGGEALLAVLDAQRTHGRAAREWAQARGRQYRDAAALYVAVAADWREPAR